MVSTSATNSSAAAQHRAPAAARLTGEAITGCAAKKNDTLTEVYDFRLNMCGTM